MYMVSITKEQATTWLKNNIDKEELVVYMQGFVDCVNSISSLTKDSKPAELKATLEKLRAGCKSMTDNYCRKLWRKGKDVGGESVEDICPLCPIYDRCIQNPKNHVEGNLYYHIVELWRLLHDYEQTKTDTYLKDNQEEIIKHVKGVKETADQAQWFQNVADRWRN